MSPNQLQRGFTYGVGATVIMSIPMVLATVAGISPMPEPIPRAVIATILGSTAAKPLLVGLAAGLHLLYGGIFGALLTATTRPVTIWKGIGLGIILWAIMQVIVLPLLGWGAFGTGITPKIAVATLVLHLVYGASLGLALSTRTAEDSTTAPTTG